MIPLARDYDTLIDPKAEIQAICRYLEATWDLESLKKTEGDLTQAPLESLVTSAFMHAHDTLKDAIDFGEAGKLVQEHQAAREEALEAMGGWGAEFPRRDGLHAAQWALYIGCIDASMDSTASVNIAYDKGIQSLLTLLSSTYAGHEQLYPKGYPEFTQNYREQQGMLDIDEPALEALFDGHEVPRVGSPQLPVRLALPHVAYDDLDQGRPPEEMLIRQIFAQGHKVREHNNLVALKQELNAWSQPERTFATELSAPDIDTPMLKRLWDEHVDDRSKAFVPLTEDEVDKKRAAQAEFDALPPEEQNRRRQASVKAILGRLTDLGPN